MAADNFHSISHALSDAPQLKVVSDTDGVFSPSVGAIPWNQLTRFHGSSASLEDCLEILRLGENLESCSFFLEAADQELDDTPDVLTHLRLKQLTLTGDGLDVLLPFLTLPALESFEIFELPDDRESVLDFLERHSSQIQNINFHHLLVNSLPHMPALTKLQLRTRFKQSYTNDLFELLQSPEGRLPSLQHIHLDGFRSREPADYETMAQALTIRWRRYLSSAEVAELRSFTLWITLVKGELIEDFEELLSPLTGLKAEGVDINVEIQGQKW